jgi:hypothetical protein
MQPQASEHTSCNITHVYRATRESPSAYSVTASTEYRFTESMRNCPREDERWYQFLYFCGTRRIVTWFATARHFSVY